MERRETVGEREREREEDSYFYTQRRERDESKTEREGEDYSLLAHMVESQPFILYYFL